MGKLLGRYLKAYVEEGKRYTELGDLPYKPSTSTLNQDGPRIIKLPPPAGKEPPYASQARVRAVRDAHRHPFRHPRAARGRRARKEGPPSKAQPALDKLKTLAGEWVYDGGEKKGQLAARYTVSSAGSAVVEQLFPGTDHEMITVYHLDGDKLMMTHYCAAGNQPRMHAEPGADKLVFTCSGGSNMKESDGHMHAMTLTFIDDDHFKEEWTWKGAQDADRAVRVRA